MSDALFTKLSSDRISSRQIDELIGLARGLIADGLLNQLEVEILQKWLAANVSATDQPLITVLYRRVTEILADGMVDQVEMSELLDTLSRFTNNDFELGETLKATSLPLCDPAPSLTFPGKSYCFTGTFNFGQRKDCEEAVMSRGATAGGLSRKTDFLVIGVYATESWKHSAFGHKILKAQELRSAGHPISIISEKHWVGHL